MGCNDIHITLSGEVAQRLRHALPSGAVSLNRRAEKIIVQWLDEREAREEAAQLNRLGKEATRPWSEIRDDLAR